jgi:hypothetical protein
MTKRFYFIRKAVRNDFMHECTPQRAICLTEALTCRLEPVSKATKQSTKYYGAVMVSGEEGKRKCVAAKLFPSHSRGILIEQLESRLLDMRQCCDMTRKCA